MTTTSMTRQATQRNGYTIEHLCEVDIKSITATLPMIVCPHCSKVVLSNAKVVYEGGKLAVDMLTDSYAYGDEVQLNYYQTHEAQIRQRVEVHNGYTRNETHLSKPQGAKLVRGIMK